MTILKIFEGTDGHNSAQAGQIRFEYFFTGFPYSTQLELGFEQKNKLNKIF